MSEAYQNLYQICKNRPELQDHGRKYVPSRGLKFEVNSIYEKTVKITGIGSCKDTEIIIPSEIDGFTVTGIGKRAFSGCAQIESVILSSSVKRVGMYAFEDCARLKEIALPKGVIVSDGAFSYCDGLREIVFPVGVISGDGLFQRCGSLTSAVISRGVTEINDWMFKDCDLLSSVIIPASVQRIGVMAFAYCEMLTSIKYEGKKDDWQKISFGMNWKSYSSVKAVTCSDGDILLG